MEKKQVYSSVTEWIYVWPLNFFFENITASYFLLKGDWKGEMTNLPMCSCALMRAPFPLNCPILSYACKMAACQHTLCQTRIRIKGIRYKHLALLTLLNQHGNDSHSYILGHSE